MNPSHFRHRVTFQIYQSAENTMGDVVSSWIDHSTRWAMIKTVQGKEFIQATAVRGESTVRFVIRYAKGITNTMQILYDGRTFEIIAPPINDDELNKTLTIMTKEVI